MIKTEFYMTRQDGANLYRTYSDGGFCIEQNTGVVYSEAIDVENSGFTYTETTTPIPDNPVEEVISADQYQEITGEAYPDT